MVIELRNAFGVERMLRNVARDLVHAARCLARSRSFTIVVVASLGIGMGTFIGLVSFTRGMTAPIRGVNTVGLVDVDEAQQGGWNVSGNSARRIQAICVGKLTVVRWRMAER